MRESTADKVIVIDIK